MWECHVVMDVMCGVGVPHGYGCVWECHVVMDVMCGVGKIFVKGDNNTLDI